MITTLYERVIVGLLTESKVDTFARQLTQKVIRAVKKTMDKINKQSGIRLKITGEWPDFIKRQDYFATPAGRLDKQRVLGIPAGGPQQVTIQLTVLVQKSKRDKEEVAVQGGWSPTHDMLTIEFFISSNTGTVRPEHLNQIQLKAYEAFRHELEHTGQSDAVLIPAVKAAQGLNSVPGGAWSSPKTMEAYLMTEAEIQAFVAGMYHRAKRTRMPFLEVVEETIEHMLNVAASHKVDVVEMRNVLMGVRYKWLEYAKKRFPNAVTQ